MPTTSRARNTTMTWCDTDTTKTIFRHLHTVFRCATMSEGHVYTHTPSIAFRHLPPNSAIFSYATEGALFISAQLSSDAVSALRQVRVLIIMTVEAT